MQPEAKKLLYDVTAAIEELESFLKGCTRDDFLHDRLLQVAVERELEIMGEALNRLCRFDNETFARIEHGSKIIGMRNVLAHGYDVIDYRIIWNTLEGDLPMLRRQIANLLPA